MSCTIPEVLLQLVEVIDGEQGIVRAQLIGGGTAIVYTKILVDASPPFISYFAEALEGKQTAHIKRNIRKIQVEGPGLGVLIVSGTYGEIIRS